MKDILISLPVYIQEYNTLLCSFTQVRENKEKHLNGEKREGERIRNNEQTRKERRV